MSAVDPRRRGRELNRRAFLRRMTAAGPQPPAATLLAACDRAAAPALRGSSILSKPRGPTFESGLPAEGEAVLKVYEWRDYLSGTLTSFERSFPDGDVRVDVESQSHGRGDRAPARPGHAVRRLLPDDRRHARADRCRVVADPSPTICCRTSGTCGRGSERGSGPSTIPQRYSLPYTVVSGVAWREDLVETADAPGHAEDPWGLFWNPSYQGRVGMYDGYLEAMSLALLRDGSRMCVPRPTPSSRQPSRRSSTRSRSPACASRTTGRRRGYPRASSPSTKRGPATCCPRRATRPPRGTSTSEEAAVLVPARPREDRGVRSHGDLRAWRFPDLAHAFLNHLLDEAWNFCWNGYQPPLRGVTPEAFAAPDSPGTWRCRPACWARCSTTTRSPTRRCSGFGPSERARWLDYWKRVAPGT